MSKDDQTLFEFDETQFQTDQNNRSNKLDFEIACTEQDVTRLEYALMMKYRELHGLYLKRRGLKDESIKGNLGNDCRGIAGQDSGTEQNDRPRKPLLR